MGVVCKVNQCCSAGGYAPLPTSTATDQSRELTKRKKGAEIRIRNGYSPREEENSKARVSVEFWTLK